jgi:hypothetical protein
VFRWFTGPPSPLPTNQYLCPSNHAGLILLTGNLIIGTYGVVGADTVFVKNNTNATDSITFPSFIAGLDPLTGDVTPINYVRYVCTNAPAGETFKSFQFPICQGVSNLDNQEMTFTVWAKATTTVDLQIFTRQYFGSGGPPASAEVRTQVGSISLTSTWTKYNVAFTVPTTALKTLSLCGDDALYIHLDMPLGVACDVSFTKPSLYIGNINPGAEFINNDQTDSTIFSPRVGTLQSNFGDYGIAVTADGWINLLNGAQIGSAASGAATLGSPWTFPLYKLTWDTMIDPYAPVIGGRGASADADFLANKKMNLPNPSGRLMGASGSGAGVAGKNFGEPYGTNTKTLSLANMPAHTHGLHMKGTGSGTSTIVRDSGTLDIESSYMESAGSGTAFDIMPPGLYLNYIIKL